MGIIIPCILIIGGLVEIFYMRTKINNSVMEVQYMKTKTISELKDMFSQMDENGLGDNYSEFVELKGNIVSDNLVQTPFSERKVAYCESQVIQVTETKQQYRDNNGNLRTRTIKNENKISEEHTSQDISVKDNSCNDKVIVEINASGCKLDIPKTLDRFEPKTNLKNYGYFKSFSINGFGVDTLGFKMIEKTISQNQNLYILGEAFKVGEEIHIGKPKDNKKPFIVTTKSEEELINNSKQKSKFALIGGIVAIIIGIIWLGYKFIG